MAMNKTTINRTTDPLLEEIQGPTPRQILRKRVRVLLGFLGAEVGEDGDFLKAISDLEQGQRVKGLQINIEVVECLNMLRDVVQITADMEIRLEDLRKVCEKRSNQIIAPVWEPRGVI